MLLGAVLKFLLHEGGVSEGFFEPLFFSCFSGGRQAAAVFHLS